MRFFRLISIILILGTPFGAFVPRRTLTPGGLAFQKWADAAFPITWRMYPNRGANVTGARDLGEVFRQAFQTWSVVSTARISFTEGATTDVRDAVADGINLVSVAPTVYNLDVPSATILYTVTSPGSTQFPGQIVEADILFNPQTALSTDVSVAPDRFDLQSLAVHEIGHLLGLDHSGLASAAMFPTSVQGSSLPRILGLDDVIGISNLYPAGDFFAGRGTVHGTVRGPSGAAIFGAHVVLVDGSGAPVVSTLTEPDGSYFVWGMAPGNYSAYAEPLDQPLTAAALPALGQAFPNQAPSTAFTTRFAAAGTTSTLTLTKTGGDNQSGSAGQSLAQPLEVTVRDASGNPVSGVVVRFAAASGGGAVVPIQAATDAQGKARTAAYLGKGATQTFIASAGTSTVSFAETGQITISLITFVDPATNSLMKELIVNEGQSIATPARVLDSTGATRTDIALTYTSSNPDVATVDISGVVRGVKAGFSTLTVSGAGVVSAATITVVQITGAADGIEISGVVQDLAQRLYLAASRNHTILLAQGLAQTPQVYAGVHQTPGFVNAGRAQSLFRNPAFLAFNQADGSLYVSDSANNVIRKVLPGTGGGVETLAGTGAAGSQNGPIETATFNNPQGLALDNAGNLWVVDSGSHAIRRINLSTRTVETIAGLAGSPGSSDGAGSQARFSGPVGIALETESVVQELGRFFQGGAPPSVQMIVADTGNGLLRRVTAGGQVETLATGGTGADALIDSKSADPIFAAGSPLLFNAPTGIAMDAFGNVYLTEPDSGRVRVVLRNGDVVAAAPAGAFVRPKGLAVTRTGKVVVASGNNTAQEIIYGQPEILSIDPSSASGKGGSQVTVRGKNFAPGTGIVVAGIVIPNVELRNTETAVFTVPALPSGRTTLTVFNRAGLAQTAFLVAPTPLSELPAGYITTIAGGSTFAGDGARASAAMLDTPYGLAIDKFGNLYIADRNNFRIRRVDARTGIITTVAGNGQEESPRANILATTSPLLSPESVAVDPKGNVYFSSSNQGQVNRVDAITGILTSFAPSGFPSLRDMAVDADGNLYLADFGNSRVLKVAAGSSTATLFAGGGSSSIVGDGGPATQAYVREPQGIAIDLNGNVYISERTGFRVRKVDRQGTITTVAGTGNCCFSGDGGLATAAGLQGPYGLAVDSDGNLYIGDNSVTTGGGSVTTHRIRKVDAATGIIRTLTTFPTEFNPVLGGPGYDFRKSMVVDGAGGLYVSFSFGHQILRVDTNTGATTPVAGIGAPFTGDGLLAAESTLLRPYGLAFDKNGSLFVTDRDMHRVRRIDGITRKIATVAGDGKYGFPVDGQAATQSSFGQPQWVAADGLGNPYVILASDTTGSGFNRKDRIWRIDAQTGIAGPFLIPFQTSLAASPTGDIYIGSLTDGQIHKYDPATGFISVFAIGLAPRSLAFDAAGNLFVADGDFFVRRIDAVTGSVTTVAGNGASSSPVDGVPATQSSISFGSNQTNRIALDASGNLYILETSRIRRVDGQTGIITSIVPSLTVSGGLRDNVTAASGSLHSDVSAIAVDREGNLLVADPSNKRIRAIRRPD